MYENIFVSKERAYNHFKSKYLFLGYCIMLSNMLI